MPYLMARKPLLAIFHMDSPAASLLKKVGGSTLVEFNDEYSPDDIAKGIRTHWLRSNSCQATVPWNDAAIEPYTDRGQAKTLCQYFDNLVTNSAKRCQCPLV